MVPRLHRMGTIRPSRSLEHDLRKYAANGACLDLGERASGDIPAQVLYDVLTSDSTPGPRAVKLRRARVVGPLNLEAATVRCPLRLETCQFSEGVTLCEASAPSIRLTECTLHSFTADQLETRGNLELTHSSTEGEVLLRGAHIHGSLKFDGTTLINPSGAAFDADGLRVDGDLLCQEGFTARGEVLLPRAHIGGKLNLDGATLINPSGEALRADRLRVEQGMFCRDGFTSEGEVRLPRARVGGQLSFSRASLSNPRGQALYAHGLRVDQSVSCDEHFAADGEMYLLGAHIGGQFLLTSATLRNECGPALIADRLRVDLNMLCNNGFSAEGEVRLYGAKIDGELSFDGATLRTRSDWALDLEGAEAETLVLRFAAVPERAVNLTDARLRRLHDKSYGTEDGWPPCRLDGCQYESLQALGSVHLDERLKWVAHDPDPNHYSPQPYEQLAAFYRKSGDAAKAQRVAIEKERGRRRKLPGPAKGWSWFLGATVGHGYRLWFAGLWLLVLVLIGSVLFGAVFDEGTKESSDLTPAKPTGQEAPYQPVIYTVDALLPVLSLGQESSWNPHGAAQWTTAGLTIVGWLLTAALLAGIVARRE